MLYPASRERLRSSNDRDSFDSFAVADGHEPSKELAVTYPVADPVFGTAVLRNCIRSVDGTVVSLENSFYPMSLARETELLSPDDIPGGAISVLARLGHPQVGYRDDVRPHEVQPAEASLLRCGIGHPALYVTRTAWSPSDVIRVTETIVPLSGGMTFRYEVGDPQ